MVLLTRKHRLPFWKPGMPVGRALDAFHVAGTVQCQYLLCFLPIHYYPPSFLTSFHLSVHPSSLYLI